MLFHFPQNMKINEYWYNNLMQGHMLLQQFSPCKYPMKFNELSCPHICVKWILRLSNSVPLLFWAPAVYQDLSMCHGWAVKKNIYIQDNLGSLNSEGKQKTVQVIGVNFSELLMKGMEI